MAAGRGTGVRMAGVDVCKAIESMGSVGPQYEDVCMCIACMLYVCVKLK